MKHLHKYTANDLQGSLVATYTYSGKERDAETGYSYFGARYYSSDLSVWLSIDPMAAKYPSLSPYTYCANNPMRVVDPDGNELLITGEQAEFVFWILQRTTNLKLTIDDYGKITATGKALNRNDKKLLKAINSTNIIVNIEADPNNKENTAGGMYCGTVYDKETNTASSLNKVDIISLNEMEKNNNAPPGSGIMHEITEGYEAGKISLKRKTNIGPAIKILTKQIDKRFEYDDIKKSEVLRTYQYDKYIPLYPKDYKLYLKAHRRATKAPNE